MKQIKFAKGIRTINIPFMLHNLTSWQEQVEEEIKKFNAKYKYSKKAHLGFEITEFGATLKLSK
jgi:hypothetical protein